MEASTELRSPENTPVPGAFTPRLTSQPYLLEIWLHLPPSALTVTGAMPKF